MSGKAKSKTTDKLKRPAPEEEAVQDIEQLLLFNDEAGPDVDDDEDLTDSEESVYSGLEDSGSDSEDDDDEEEEEDKEAEISSSAEVKSGIETAPQGQDAKGKPSKQQSKSQKSAPKKKVKAEGENEKLERQPSSAALGDEYEQDSSDEEVSTFQRQPRSAALIDEYEQDSSDEEVSTFQRQPRSAALIDEYEQDSSDEEDIRNTVGNIPMEWYKDYPHIGYDLDGKKIFKPIRNKDELDEFLEKMDNPDYWRTVHDKKTGSDIRLTDEQIDLVHRLQKGQFGDVSFNQYEPSIDFFSHETMIHPVTNRPEHKRSFIPSLIEKEKVRERSVVVLNPGLGDILVSSVTEQLISSFVEPEEEKTQAVQWVVPETEALEKGVRLIIRHPKSVKQVTWHGKGDYLASVMPDNGNTQVLIHQLSKRRSQNPFRKNKGLVQCVAFHPSRPAFFVATQCYVRVYNLIKQELTKKLLANCKWVSSMAIHPGGDNVICGSYDSRFTWFDLDLSTKPYKVLRHHKKALRGVAFHKSYPLFASASDDGSVIVCHGMVYNDLLQNPLIVPVKVLKGHEITRDLGVLDVAFHPTQPWVFSSGADSTIRLFT
ncbi:Ribosome biogenesis protein bop1 [Acipenser ruthenus]|uniref:Ribosome biogenesis protein bop1 n=1 Tax=Acipenser ruthenus TaxID=7906 RepID=A0A444TWR9_ACIRT|nr:Ribosome biogenesis protein bop1 [Acipenser ruthenus]